MLKKSIQKPKRSFNEFIKEKLENDHNKKAQDLKKSILKPKKNNEFKDLRLLKHKIRNITANKKSSKKKFDLNSDDDEATNNLNILKHKGQNLDLVDDFNENIENLSNTDQENSELNEQIVNEMHFGGFEGDFPPNSHGQKRSKQEIYKEIIKKSKKMKYEKQKLREENQNKVEEIDQNTETFHKILELKLTKEQKKAQKTEEDDEYNQLARDLFLDGKTYANANFSLKDPKKKENPKKTREKRGKNNSDSEENDEISNELDDEYKNDEVLEEGLSREKRGIGYEIDKKQKKTQNINKFLENLQEIKRNKMGISNDSEENSDEDLEPDDEEEDDENDDNEEEDYEDSEE